MAKSKVKQLKPRKKSSKYTKLLAVATKELAGRKKALIQAERALAKAKQKHEELIAEVARLDMVERSLRAMVEGTEPPTSIKYVYQYPYWVWTYPYTQPYITYTVPSAGTTNIWNTTTSIPTTYTQTGNLQTADFMVTNAQSGSMVNAQSGSFSLTASNASGTSLVNDGISNVTLTSGLNTATYTTAGGEGLVVDLTTHAELEDVPPAEPVAEAASSSAS